MSQIYKITLNPMGSFYFGGEDSFSSTLPNSIQNQSIDKVKDYFKKRQGYFAKGEMFPQQTQLLGMLRKEILKQNKKLLYFKNFIRVPTPYRASASRLVGDRAWSSSDELSLGKICKLSPLYLEEVAESRLYVPSPVDRGLALIEEDSNGYINGRPTKVYGLQKCNGEFFGAKDYLDSGYIAKGKYHKSLEELFSTDTRVHTQTYSYKKDDDEQLFKVRRFYLDSDFIFVCYLTLDNEQTIKEGESTVDLGGEESHFVIQVEKVDALPKTKEIYQEHKTNHTRIVLESDTYIDSASQLNKHIRVLFANKTILRTIAGNKEHSFKKSQKVVMLKRGSVIYPKCDTTECISAIKEILQCATNYTKIGYNQYHIIQGEDHASN